MAAYRYDKPEPDSLPVVMTCPECGANIVLMPSGRERCDNYGGCENG